MKDTQNDFVFTHGPLVHGFRCRELPGPDSPALVACFPVNNSLLSHLLSSCTVPMAALHFSARKVKCHVRPPQDRPCLKSRPWICVRSRGPLTAFYLDLLQSTKTRSEGIWCGTHTWLVTARGKSASFRWAAVRQSNTYTLNAPLAKFQHATSIKLEPWYF